MQPQFMQPVFVQVEQYYAYLKKSTSIVLNIHYIRYVGDEYVVCEGFDEPLSITKESAKHLQDFFIRVLFKCGVSSTTCCATNNSIKLIKGE